MFKPVRCPYAGCTHHTEPRPDFYKPYGHYRVLCRPDPVPRFRCTGCKRTFSRQTFRGDFRDHKPHINERLFELLASGMGLRQSGRLLHLSLGCVQMKARKMGLQLRSFNLTLRGTLPPGSKLQFDELETFEACRNTRPLTVPVLLDTKTRFVIWSESASIRPKGTMTKKRLAAIARDEKRFGPRKDESRASILRTLEYGKSMIAGLQSIHIDTDEKKLYPSLIQQVFSDVKVTHRKTSSKLARNVANPLFPVNQTEAIARDLMGRLRRESWLVSKRGKWLDVALHVFMAYRNYVRPRFNRDKRSPAAFLGFLPRCLSPAELLGWRQDLGLANLHPLTGSTGGMELAGTE